MAPPEPQSQGLPPVSRRERIDKAGDQFERQWRAGKAPRIEDFLEQGTPADRAHLLRELIALELELRADAGEEIAPQDYHRRFPQYQAIVDSVLALTDPQPSAGPGETESCAQPERATDGVENRDPATASTELPQAIGRYLVQRELGRGGFGVVYLARDPMLYREVAIKVPLPKHFGSEQALAMFLREAPNAAQLDHPGIVRVFDVQQEHGLVYIVQQYIDGEDLQAYAKSNRPSPTRVAELMIEIADAVGYANAQGFVHRDLKPANIFLDANGKPYVADFGLALHESVQRDHAGDSSGSRPYMSPEQTRGEAHRMDGRSDIWSLGVILYELLTGRRPFDGKTRDQVWDEIRNRDPRPLRQIDPTLPRELSRICLTCLAKRATDRYQAAADLMADLQHWLQSERAAAVPDVQSDAPSTPAPTDPVKIVPKGLRSFDAADADFFLGLLPGPYDREGLPKTVRFWKTQLEQSDPDETIPVGLMYGPSGCGKSSLVKAGLIPRLSEDVLPVYVEATADDTEVRLLRSLRKRCPELPPDAALPEVIAHLRESSGSRRCKVVVILDQFEQWLHAHESLQENQLVLALRQCDGANVQTLVMVRDDFWMSATRFMQALEFPLLEDRNSAAVDLFDPDHARNVLAAFGRAYGKLPELPDEPDEQQKGFLRRAVSGLTQEGKVISVRLALFAEMMKGKPWTASSLDQVGGTEGVGVTFLDETFSPKTAPPSHRLHQEAVRAILKTLLPEHGTDIKGQMKSYDELLEVSGYTKRRPDFDNVLVILDSELRLITPTDPDETMDDDAAPVTAGPARFYQLTHDYLVHSLRQWLTREQGKTRRGRAELKLAERSALWNAKPENRHLPSWWEYLGIRLFTDHTRYSEPQRTMMRRADRVQGTRLAAAVCLLAFVATSTMVGVNRYRRDFAKGYVEQLLQTSADGVVPFTELLRPLSWHAVPMLSGIPEDRQHSSSERLHAACAMAEFGESDFVFPVAAVRDVDAGECSSVVSALEDGPKTWISALNDEIKAADAEQDWPFKARLSIVALQLGNLRPAEDMLQIEDRPDPIQRTQFIETFIDWHADLGPLTQYVQSGKRPALQSGLCLAVGSIKDINTENKTLWQNLFEHWYRTEPDGGTHSAAGWALRQWNITEPAIGGVGFPREERGWSISETGLTMIRIPAGEFERPVDPNSDPDGQKQTIEITQAFLLSDREVSVKLFKSFVNDEDYKGEKPANWKTEYQFPGVSPAHPVQQVTWYDTLMLCNWLSLKEKRTPCYTFNADKWELDLDADGYRLPTEAEWEYAARGGVTTCYVFGNDASLLGAYAVYGANNVQHCGTKRPSNNGLFDIHGNVKEWCSDYWEATFSEDDVANPIGPRQGNGHVLRGGSFDKSEKILQLTSRTYGTRGSRNGGTGFRLARTATIGTTLPQP